MTTETVKPVTETVRVGSTDPATQKAMNDALAALNAAVPPAKEAAPAPTPAPVTQTPVEPEPCPRCGHTKDGANKPQETDIQEYTRSILGGRQFTKTYKLLSGQLIFKFGTLNGAGSEHLNNIIIAMNKFDDVIKYNALALKYRILFMLREYSISGRATTLDIPTVADLPPGDFEACHKMFHERIEHLDQGIVQMIAQTLMLFRSLEAALIEGAFDETFWRGAGPC